MLTLLLWGRQDGAFTTGNSQISRVADLRLFISEANTSEPRVVEQDVQRGVTRDKEGQEEEEE